MEKEVKTNIELIGVNVNNLEKVLTLCKNENISYRFDSNPYTNENKTICYLLKHLMRQNKEIPIIFKDVIEKEFLQFLDCYSDEDKDKIKKSLEEIIYI